MMDHSQATAELDGLNNVHQHRHTVLHWAMRRRLQEAAVAIATRPDVSGINISDLDDWTALHYAAVFGFLPVCRAILGRPDFTELQAVIDDGTSALQLAWDHSHQAVAEFLEEAEAQLQGTWRCATFWRCAAGCMSPSAEGSK